MLHKILITLLLIAISNAQNFKNQLSGGYSGRGGNTEYWYYNLNYALTANGDINFGSLTLKDSEFLLSIDRNVSEYNGAPYYNDQTIVFKFDLWANGTFSPFVIAETAFDEALGIKKRQNFGLGAKYRVLGDFLSVSAAFLSEKEEVFGKNNVYEYVDYDTNDDGVGDSLGVYTYSNYGDMPTFDYSRISIRPKLKLPLGDNFYYQTEYYYKPAGDDVLTNWNNTLSISTAEKWLKIEIRYNIKTDSKPAPKRFLAYSSTYPPSSTFDSAGIEYDRNTLQSSEDGFSDKYHILDYRSSDESFSIGISITF